MSADPSQMTEEIRAVLFPDEPAGGFDPVGRWEDLGRLLEALEDRGCFLMTNSVDDPTLRRMASFHRSTARGYPCVGSSEWGMFARVGEAIVVAAHETLINPRVKGLGDAS